jgi:hypothetical protein
MTIQPIDIGTHLKAGFDPLAGLTSIAVNVIMDKSGVVRRRPVRAVNAIAPSAVIDANGIDLLHVANNGKIFAVGGYNVGRDIYAIGAGSSLKLSGVTNGKLMGDRRVTIAETEAMIVMAAGANPQKVLLDTLQSSPLGGNPPIGSHIISNSLRLLLNDSIVDKTKLNFSELASGSIITGHETWGVVAGASSGWFTAEARPDPIVAVGELTNSVLIWGSNSLQLYVPDATWVYAPLKTLEYGCLAPYSIIRADDKYYWLDQYKRFVCSEGSAVSVVSEHIAPLLVDLAHPEDCFGYRVKTKFIDCLVWTFTTDGRTFCLDTANGWSQWCEWDAGNDTNGPTKLTAAAYDSVNGVTWVGTNDGYVRALGHVESAEDPLVARVRTGYEDRGTSLHKLCQALYITVRRGETSYSEITSISVAWSDKPGSWSQPIVLPFGSTSDRDPVLMLTGLGSYRQRAWEFVISGPENVAIVSVREQFEVSEV